MTMPEWMWFVHGAWSMRKNFASWQQNFPLVEGLPDCHVELALDASFLAYVGAAFCFFTWNEWGQRPTLAYRRFPSCTFYPSPGLGLGLGKQGTRAQNFCTRPTHATSWNWALHLLQLECYTFLLRKEWIQVLSSFKSLSLHVFLEATSPHWIHTEIYLKLP